MKEEIRNSEGKLVCEYDKHNQLIEIKVKGIITCISFSADGELIIIEK